MAVPIRSFLVQVKQANDSVAGALMIEILNEMALPYALPPLPFGCWPLGGIDPKAATFFGTFQ